MPAKSAKSPKSPKSPALSRADLALARKVARMRAEGKPWAAIYPVAPQFGGNVLRFRALLRAAKLGDAILPSYVRTPEVRERNRAAMLARTAPKPAPRKRTPKASAKASAKAPVRRSPRTGKRTAK